MTYLNIDSSEARNNLPSIIDSVYLDKKKYIINRLGVPLASIIPIDKNKMELLKYAGILSEKEAKKIKDRIKKGRKDGSKKLKYLA